MKSRNICTIGIPRHRGIMVPPIAITFMFALTRLCVRYRMKNYGLEMFLAAWQARQSFQAKAYCPSPQHLQSLQQHSWQSPRVYSSSRSLSLHWEWCSFLLFEWFQFLQRREQCYWKCWRLVVVGRRVERDVPAGIWDWIAVEMVCYWKWMEI